MISLMICLFGFDCYVEFYSYQSFKRNNPPGKTHVFASFYKDNERVDISWCPERNWKLFGGPVKGKHKSLNESIKDAKGKSLRFWGRFCTTEEIFERAKRQKNLNYYHALDKKTRPNAVNCIHAVSDIFGYVETKKLRGHESMLKIIKFAERKGLIWRSSK